VSYYAKGALVACCLDAEIRRATDGEKNLDNVMHVLWANWQSSGGAGIDETEPERIASEVAGKDLSDFFQQALYATDDLPLAASLRTLGVDLDFRARSSTSTTATEEATPA